MPAVPADSSRARFARPSEVGEERAEVPLRAGMRESRPFGRLSRRSGLAERGGLTLLADAWSELVEGPRRQFQGPALRSNGSSEAPAPV